MSETGSIYNVLSDNKVKVRAIIIAESYIHTCIKKCSQLCVTGSENNHLGHSRSLRDFV